MGIIEQFYFGNINPQARCVRPGSETAWAVRRFVGARGVEKCSAPARGQLSSIRKDELSDPPADPHNESSQRKQRSGW